MNRGFADVIMNPVRQRIIQFLLIKGEGTVSEMTEAIGDIPKPSLYRHVKVLSDAGCLTIAREKAARGAIERTYALTTAMPGLEPTRENMSAIFQSTLMLLAGRFARYFTNEKADPAADKLGMSSSTLMLTDAEYDELFAKIGAIYAEYLKIGAGEGRKPRCITIISSPGQGMEDMK